MKKEVRKAFVAGIVNGVVFTFAFLIFLVEMCDNPNTEEDLHPEENLAVDTIISDLSMFAKEDVEKEYLIPWLEQYGKRNGIIYLIWKK